MHLILEEPVERPKEKRENSDISGLKMEEYLTM